MGSITIDRDLLDASGILVNEFVLVADVANGARFETYVLEGAPGSGIICVNGAAALLVRKGDPVIVMASAYATAKEARRLQPTVVLVDERNQPIARDEVPAIRP